MNAVSVEIVAAIMRSAQRTPFRGTGGGYGGVSSANPFRQAKTEAAGVATFTDLFADLPAALAGKTVLDFGCGYGGKTVEYGRTAAFVAGIEPLEHPIEMARRYATEVGSAAEFKVCAQDSIPYPDERFDVVVSHDVLEHVADPEVSLREIRRVLRPGGVAYIVCPPYDGALSHHLDYVTTAPGLHWVFSAETLVAAANRLIVDERYNTSPQPAPGLGWKGDRRVLPQLNGMTGPQFEQMAGAMFSEATIGFRKIGARRLPALARTLDVIGRISPVVRDGLTSSIVAKLIK
jgi:2-polyprenyl-3-methyl-5-hydroxy-6-metoxy-1,4-benzoquinol methylase